MFTYKTHTNGEKEKKELGVVIQDNLSLEKYIDRIFGDTLMMAFHFLDKVMKRKIMTLMIRLKLEYTIVI